MQQEDTKLNKTKNFKADNKKSLIAVLCPLPGNMLILLAIYSQFFLSTDDVDLFINKPGFKITCFILGIVLSVIPTVYLIRLSSSRHANDSLKTSDIDTIETK